MEDVLYFIAATGFLFWVGRNTVYWIFLFQKHGYSMRSLRRYASVFGIAKLFSPISLIKWSLILFYPFVIFRDEYLSGYHLFISILYLTECIIVFKEILRTNIFQKNFTYKSISLSIVSLLIIFTLFVFPPLDRYLWLLILDRTLIVIIIALVMLYILPEEFYRDYREALVQKKLQLQKPTVILLVGGIENAYQKKLLSYVLSMKQPVIATPSFSGRDAILQTIQHRLPSSHSYVIADFSSGSIDDLASISMTINPEIVIINSLDTFSESLKPDEKLRSTISKLIQARRVYINSDNSLLKHTVRTRRRNVRFYSKHSIQHLVLKKDRMSFRWNDLTITSEMVSPALANALPPVLEGLSELKFSSQNVNHAVKKIAREVAFAQVLQKDGITLLNNSGDRTPNTILMLNPYIHIFHKQKILVIDADWTTGNPTQEAFLRVGRAVSEEYDYVFLLPSPGAKLIRNGSKEAKNACFSLIATSRRIAKTLTEIAKKGDIIVFHGEMSEEVLTLLIENEERFSL